MASKLFQSIVSQMQSTVGRTAGVLDESGCIIACSDLSRIGQAASEEVASIGGYVSVGTVINGTTYRAIGNETKPEYIVFVDGSDDMAEKLAGVLSISLGGVQEFYNDRFSRADFLKNIILDNILTSDIYQTAKELRFLGDTRRVAILLRLADKLDLASIEVVQALFPERQKDFVFSINDNDIVLIKEVRQDTETEHLEQLARSIVDVLEGDLYAKTYVGIGTIVNDIRDLNRSFKEAQIAIEVGKVFEEEKTIISYNNLGVGRLVYQLPTTLCEMFLDEVFKRGSIESLDQEILFTIQKFFENNLNVSETARKLFVHRNTLVYRLDKIRRITGLDLREFDHAIIFKVALMVKKYLTSKPVQY